MATAGTTLPSSLALLNVRMGMTTLFAAPAPVQGCSDSFVAPTHLASHGEHDAGERAESPGLGLSEGAGQSVQQRSCCCDSTALFDM